MSNLTDSILSVMNDGEWITNTELSGRIGTSCSSVRTALQKLQESGFIVKRDDPSRHQGVLYKKSRMPGGFGISRNLADFQSLVQRVRP